MATLRHNLANIVSVPMTMLSLSMKKLMYPNSLHFSGIHRFSPGVVMDLDRKSKVYLGKHISIHSRGRIAAIQGGVLSIGDNSGFNVGCIVTCRDRITIGKNVSFGPNVMLFDHNHIMSVESGVKDGTYQLGEIVIGDNCWIGAGSVILLGTHIGNNCVIAAGSVIKGDIPDNTVLIQKRVNTYKGMK